MSKDTRIRLWTIISLLSACGILMLYKAKVEHKSEKPTAKPQHIVQPPIRYEVEVVPRTTPKRQINTLQEASAVLNEPRNARAKAQLRAKLEVRLRLVDSLLQEANRLMGKVRAMMDSNGNLPLEGQNALYKAKLLSDEVDSIQVEIREITIWEAQQLIDEE